MERVDAELVYENTDTGIFLKRINRFTAQVLMDGERELVHVKNTGRLRELLVPGREVTLQRVNRPERKTSFDLISVYKPGLKWVNVDSLAPNVLANLWLQHTGYKVIRPEYTIGESRIDFYMERRKKKYLTEVKGCTLADPDHRSIGLFPDAPTERGVKHLRELAKAAGEGYLCTIMFVIQMNTIHRVLPNDQTHPEFGEALRQAVKAGVRVVDLNCHVESDRVRVTREIDDTARFQ